MTIETNDSSASGSLAGPPCMLHAMRENIGLVLTRRQVPVKHARSLRVSLHDSLNVKKRVRRHISANPHQLIFPGYVQLLSKCYRQYSTLRARRQLTSFKAFCLCQN